MLLLRPQKCAEGLSNLPKVTCREGEETGCHSGLCDPKAQRCPSPRFTAERGTRDSCEWHECDTGIQIITVAPLGPALCGWTGSGPLAKVWVGQEVDLNRRRRRRKGGRRKSGGGRRRETIAGCIKHSLMPLRMFFPCVSDEWWSPDDDRIPKPNLSLKEPDSMQLRPQLPACRED